MRAENYLAAAPEDLLEDKSFLEKLPLVLKYMPVFVLTAIFRIGSGVIKVTSGVIPGIFSPISPSFSMLLHLLYMIIFLPTLQLLAFLLRYKPVLTIIHKMQPQAFGQFLRPADSSRRRRGRDGGVYNHRTLGWAGQTGEQARHSALELGYFPL